MNRYAYILNLPRKRTYCKSTICHNYVYSEDHEYCSNECEKMQTQMDVLDWMS